MLIYNKLVFKWEANHNNWAIISLPFPSNIASFVTSWHIKLSNRINNFCSIWFITNKNSSYSNNGYGTPPHFLKIALDIFSNSREHMFSLRYIFYRKLFESLIWKRFLMNYVITEKVICFKDSNLVCYVMIIQLQRIFYKSSHFLLPRCDQ